MSTNEDKSKAFRQVVKKSEYARMMNKNYKFVVCKISTQIIDCRLRGL